MYNKGGILYSLVENRESSLITLRTCSGWIHCTLQFVRIFFHRCCSAELLSSLRNFPWGHEKHYHLTAPKIKFNPLKDLSSKITNYITKIPFQVLLKIKKRILLKDKFNYQYILREIKSSTNVSNKSTQFNLSKKKWISSIIIFLKIPQRNRVKKSTAHNFNCSTLKRLESGAAQ